MASVSLDDEPRLALGIPEFDRVLDMVRVVRGLGMEACVTLGMLSESQAERLAGAGLTAYNHNLDTSREHYRSIVTTRTYEDRLATLRRVRAAGSVVRVCVLLHRVWRLLLWTRDSSRPRGRSARPRRLSLAARVRHTAAS